MRLVVVGGEGGSSRSGGGGSVGGVGVGVGFGGGGGGRLASSTQSADRATCPVVATATTCCFVKRWSDSRSVRFMIGPRAHACSPKKSWVPALAVFGRHGLASMGSAGHRHRQSRTLFIPIPGLCLLNGTDLLTIAHRAA
jgi:hypothetical protein